MRITPIASALILIVIITNSCKNSDTGKLNEQNSPVDSSAFLLNDTSNLEVFVLPTPLQLGAVLKNANLTYKESNFIKPKDDYGILTRGQTALILGAISVDAGYNALYAQNQTALKYGRSITNLINSLKINTIKTKNLIERFEKNAQNSDSLTYIIMQSYQSAHDYFRENNLEELGLQIISGSFFEGLFILCDNYNTTSFKKLAPFFAQQKLYVENLFNLLSFYSKNQESSEIIKHLLKIQNCLQDLKIEFDNDQLTSTLNQNHIDSLRVLSKNARKELFGI